MNKKRNTILLFSFCFLILLGLQVFYIYNSYRLQEKDLIRKAREIADEVIVEMEKFTQVNEEQFVESFWMSKYMTKVPQAEIDSFRRVEKTPEQLTMHLEQVLAEKAKGTNLEIALKNEIHSIYDKDNKKELLTKEHPVIFYQTRNKVKNGFTMSEGKWNSNLSHSNTETNVVEVYSYKIKSRTSFQLMNIQSLVIQKIVPLCLVSMLILALMLYIFRKNIKNIELQDKKIAQLHTTIDSITHELNTPIATMKFLLASKEKGASEIVLERQIQRLQQIVASVHATDSEGELVTENEIQLLIQRLQQDYPTLQILASVHFEQNNQLSANNLEAILFNFIDNSFKYKAQKVHLELDFTKTILLTISDDGMGIPKEEQTRIFEKYYRVSRKENHEINGLGVGLYLVNNIVERNNGTIQVASNTNGGITFNISLPNEK
jgi:K+-sensing histidine kinase KdpD